MTLPDEYIHPACKLPPCLQVSVATAACLRQSDIASVVDSGYAHKGRCDPIGP
jgi:hypothetical protein